MKLNAADFVDPDGDHAPLNHAGNELVSPSGSRYPIVNGIPRFVDSDNYARSFGFQWNHFSGTQLDSHTGLDLTRSRLERSMRGHLVRLRGKHVLEAGSGAGRFTEILLAEGALLHSFDYSSAVEANAKNNGDRDNVAFAQADIRRIPFRKAHYDYVLCLGVIQHTPDPEQSIRCLFEHVKPGGYLAIDHYAFSWPIMLCGYQVYRQYIKRLPRSEQYTTVKRLVDFWFPIHWRFRDQLWMQRILRRLSPVFFYYPHLGLPDRETYYQWALMDTHDGTTDHYKHHRTVEQIRACLADLGAVDIEVSLENGRTLVEAMCRKKP